MPIKLTVRQHCFNGKRMDSLMLICNEMSAVCYAFDYMFAVAYIAYNRIIAYYYLLLVTAAIDW